jgi:threonine dehydrogenase-like Zn-dependent dehydrogenase
MAEETMWAVRRHGNRRVSVERRPIPRPGPGQVLIRMKASGICGSDLHGFRSPTPSEAILQYIPGHEPCGIIAELGPGVTGWSTGDRVVVYHRYTCRHCRQCRTGFRNLCTGRDPAGRRAYGANPDGADAEYMVAEADDLLPLPDALDFVEGALLACQVGTAYYGLRNIDVTARDRLLVTGLGPVGLLTILLAKTMGVEVIGADPAPERRRLAESLGADVVLDPTTAPLGRQVLAHWPDGATAWAETSGAPAAHAAIPEAAAVNARVALLGLGHSEPVLPLTRLFARQITVMGSNLWPNAAWDEIVEFVVRKRVPIRRVVGYELAIQEAPQGFALADSAAGGKVIFRFE